MKLEDKAVYRALVGSKCGFHERSDGGTAFISFRVEIVTAVNNRTDRYDYDPTIGFISGTCYQVTFHLNPYESKCKNFDTIKECQKLADELSNPDSEMYKLNS